MESPERRRAEVVSELSSWLRHALERSGYAQRENEDFITSMHGAAQPGSRRAVLQQIDRQGIQEFAALFETALAKVGKGKHEYMQELYTQARRTVEEEADILNSPEPLLEADRELTEDELQAMTQKIIDAELASETADMRPLFDWITPEELDAWKKMLVDHNILPSS